MSEDEFNTIGLGHHRWFYGFKRTWDFLKYSMLSNGTMIRPTQDVLTSLVNPEKSVKSIDKHIMNLKLALY